LGFERLGRKKTLLYRMSHRQNLQKLASRSPSFYFAFKKVLIENHVRKGYSAIS
jgi:hypothetical protein